MKKLLILMCLLALAACKSKKATTSTAAPKPPEPKVVRIAADKIDEDQKQKAYELGRRVLMTCNTSKFKPFNSSEATPEVIRNTTEERLTKTCHNFRLKYGEFRDIRFVEAVRDKAAKVNIYRFKAQYSKPIANKELRVTVNEQNRVSAIKSLDWKDKF